jgi:ABC-2 type transport system permease protein/lipopolysaccharide transport system permease protein
MTGADRLAMGADQQTGQPAGMVSVAITEVDPDSAAEWPPLPSRAALAWRDLADGFGKSWMWAALALQDIKLRYRGSVLGPFWLTISTLVMVVAMGLIYGRLFHMDTTTYLPYLSLGLIVWGAFSSMITEGCETFLREQSVIQQVPIPFSIHAYRNVCRNFIVLAHNLVIVPIGLVAFAIPVTWHSLEIIPGFLLLAINGVWISILLGLISARFRDVPPIVASFLQVLFFVTPIFWPVEMLGDWQAIATLNPLFAAIDVVRAPLLGVPTAESSWLVLLLMTVVGSGVTFAMFARFRTRIAYWI